MTKDEALKLALEALERCVATCFDPYAHEQAMSWSEHFVNQTITAIKEALAQPEQERVAWVGLDLDNMAEAFHRVIEEHYSRKNPFHDPINGDAMLALRELRGLIAYMKRNTAPPQRTWVGLTDEEVEDFVSALWPLAEKPISARLRAIEAKLKEKNT